MIYDPIKDNISAELRRIYSTYIEQIVWRGCTKQEAALRVGVDPDQVEQWIRNAETDPYVLHLIEQETAKLDPQKAWSANAAIVHLLRLVENPTEKGSVKLGAIDRLNVLLGITEVDSAGNTRKLGHTLADFQRLTAKPSQSKPH